RRQPRAPHARNPHARRPASRPSRRARFRPRRDSRRRHQRAGDGEHNLRRLRGRRRPHQPRSRAALGCARTFESIERRHHRTQSAGDQLITKFWRGKKMTERIFNFSAGPAVLPVPVLEKAREEMLSLPGVGMSVMEISHRSKTFDAIHQSAKAGLKELLGIPDGYQVLFLQGGASLQFSMIPLNFLNGGSSDYILTGSWGKKAIKEAKKHGAVNVAADMADSRYN